MLQTCEASVDESNRSLRWQREDGGVTHEEFIDDQIDRAVFGVRETDLAVRTDLDECHVRVEGARPEVDIAGRACLATARMEGAEPSDTGQHGCGVDANPLARLGSDRIEVARCSRGDDCAALTASGVGEPDRIEEIAGTAGQLLNEELDRWR